MLRSTPLIWLLTCMYAIASQMCCCQRANMAQLVFGGIAIVVEQPHSAPSATHACCGNCADAAATTDSRSERPNQSCSDCEQCADGSGEQAASLCRSIVPAAVLGSAMVVAASIVEPPAIMPLAVHAPANQNALDRGQVTLVRLHCALMV